MFSWPGRFQLVQKDTIIINNKLIMLRFCGQITADSKSRADFLSDWQMFQKCSVKKKLNFSVISGQSVVRGARVLQFQLFALSCWTFEETFLFIIHNVKGKHDVLDHKLSKNMFVLSLLTVYSAIIYCADQLTMMTIVDDK